FATLIFRPLGGVVHRQFRSGPLHTPCERQAYKHGERNRCRLNTPSSMASAISRSWLDQDEVRATANLEGVTVVTEDPSSGALVGARVSCQVPRQSAKRHPLVLDQQLATRYPKDAIVTRVLDHLTAPVDLYSHYNVDTVVDFKYLVVLEAMRSRSISQTSSSDFSHRTQPNFVRPSCKRRCCASARWTKNLRKVSALTGSNSVLLVEYNDLLMASGRLPPGSGRAGERLCSYAKRIE
uniref:SET domain-containing protein n=1 Tax=Macrostomum lignano TaxID=282301 RepID=A0A1I8FEM6_9PLAT